jgi:hypothetical protein
VSAQYRLVATCGEALNAGQSFRQLADYTGDPVSLNDAQCSVAQASAFIEAVGRKFIST